MSCTAETFHRRSRSAACTAEKQISLEITLSIEASGFLFCYCLVLLAKLNVVLCPPESSPIFLLLCGLKVNFPPFFYALGLNKTL